MTIAFPTSGNFIDYADRFVDPALAFGAGFAEWLGKSSCFDIFNQRLTHIRVDCRGGF
jgi:amino acid permease